MSTHPRCASNTVSGTKCKKFAITGQRYCRIHQRRLPDRTNVGQDSAVFFSRQEEGPGLLKELWALIASHFTVLELRPLLLTCKTLFNLFTSDKWYSDHRRYLRITESDDRPFVSDFQTEESKKLVYTQEIIHPQWVCVIKERTYGLSLSGWDKAGIGLPALFVVNSYSAARQVYRLCHSTNRVYFDVDAKGLTAIGMILALLSFANDIYKLVHVDLIWFNRIVQVNMGAFGDLISKKEDICHIIAEMVAKRFDFVVDYEIGDGFMTFSKRKVKVKKGRKKK